MFEVKIIGFIVSETKSGNIGTTIYYEMPHDEYRQDTSIKCEGTACESDYISGDFSSKLRVGATVSLVYGKGFQGKAVLRDIVPLDTVTK